LVFHVPSTDQNALNYSVATAWLQNANFTFDVVVPHFVRFDYVLDFVSQRLLPRIGSL